VDKLKTKQVSRWLNDMRAAYSLVPAIAVYGAPLRLAEMIASKDPRRRKRGLRILDQHMHRTVGAICNGADNDA
jgi:hypothetical protein